MITIWKQKDNQLHRSAILERACWLQVTSPSDLEVDSLGREYGIDAETILDILDIDERSRYESFPEYRLIIYRVPLKSSESQIPYRTIPLGIVLVDGLIITVCSEEPVFIERVHHQSAERYCLARPNSFVHHLMARAAAEYLRFLKDINRKTSGVEKDLQKSIRNNELIRLLDMEKALVHFTTSLKSNELVIDKMCKGAWKGLAEGEMDVLDDVITENRQAIEMANIYSNILSGMMDAFASVISNNLNTVMKRLTSISIALMIPTLFASLYGMNLSHLPFSRSPFAFLGIASISVVAAVLGSWLFTRAGKLR